MSRLLIVEDDPELRYLLVDAMDDFGHQAWGAENAAAALQEAERTRFDLVITDVRMEGIDGLELLLSLRDRQPQARSIVITGYADERAPIRAIQAHAEDYLYKPFTVKDLLASIRRVLGEQKEASKYGKLLAAVAASYRRLLQNASSDPDWRAVEKKRGEVYRAFFVGVRSGLLSRPNARTIWNDLHDSEVLRCAVKRHDASTPRRLHQRLEHTLAMISSLKNVKTRLVDSSSSPVQTTDFSKLYENMRQGKVSVEQLKLAHILYNPRVQEPSLLELRSHVWGE